MQIWKSTGIYEHPAKHQAGTYGNVYRHTTGIYTLQVGGAMLPCPQDWAAGIEKSETEPESITLRLTASEKNSIEQQAALEHYTNVSEYIRKTLLDRARK